MVVAVKLVVVAVQLVVVAVQLVVVAVQLRCSSDFHPFSPPELAVAKNLQAPHQHGPRYVVLKCNAQQNGKVELRSESRRGGLVLVDMGVLSALLRLTHLDK